MESPKVALAGSELQREVEGGNQIGDTCLKEEKTHGPSLDHGDCGNRGDDH